MAEIMGLSKKTLIQIEKGRISAGWTVAIAFCALFRESEVIQSLFGSDPLEVASMVAFQHYERPREKTMGGKVWWREVKNLGGYRLQQNLISQHFRILDKADRRWCNSFDEVYMRKRLQELADAERVGNDSGKKE